MANCWAPLPTSITCGVFSITLRATEIGCLIRSRKATLPQLKNSSIIHASKVTNPSRSGLAPRPTQQFCDASVTITPCSTASRARPPTPRTFQAALLASRPASQVDITMALPLTGIIDSSPPTTLPDSTAADPNTDEVMNFLRLIIVYLYAIEIKALQSPWTSFRLKCF